MQSEKVIIMTGGSSGIVRLVGSSSEWIVGHVVAKEVWP